jgi:hypothetical protein
MNLILFFVVIVSSFIVVRIGAVAFQLTGLEWSLAKFQSLSCFTGTGFTTKEAELITSHPQRRRVASVLMVLGNAGIVTLIATFANTLRPTTLTNKITIPFIHLVFPPHILPVAKLAVIILSIFLIYKVFTYPKFVGRLTSFLRKRLKKADIIKSVSFEELLVSTAGYGVSKIEIRDNSPVLNKTLQETKLRSFDINILVIERGSEIIPNPPATTRFTLGDRVVCFGKLETIKKQIAT